MNTLTFFPASFFSRILQPRSLLIALSMLACCSSVQAQSREVKMTKEEEYWYFYRFAIDKPSPTIQVPHKHPTLLGIGQVPPAEPPKAVFPPIGLPRIETPTLNSDPLPQPAQGTPASIPGYDDRTPSGIGPDGNGGMPPAGLDDPYIEYIKDAGPVRGGGSSAAIPVPYKHPQLLGQSIEQTEEPVLVLPPIQQPLPPVRDPVVVRRPVTPPPVPGQNGMRRRNPNVPPLANILFGAMSPNGEPVSGKYFFIDQTGTITSLAGSFTVTGDDMRMWPVAGNVENRVLLNEAPTQASLAAEVVSYIAPGLNPDQPQYWRSTGSGKMDFDFVPGRVIATSQQRHVTDVDKSPVGTKTHEIKGLTDRLIFIPDVPR